MPTPLPGMDSYLEHPDVWPDVHHGLIEPLRGALAPLLRLRCRVMVDKRAYRVEPAAMAFSGRPGVSTVRMIGEAEATYAPAAQPHTARVPVPDLVEQGHLEVRDPIPTFSLPLHQGDNEPTVDLGHLLHELYSRAGYDLRIDYSQEPVAPLGEADTHWAAELAGSQRQLS